MYAKANRCRQTWLSTKSWHESRVHFTAFWPSLTYYFALPRPLSNFHYRFTAPTQVSDNEANAGKQLARMLFHFGYHATGLVPALGLIGETLVDSLWASGWSVGLLEALA